ncbi:MULTISPECIES: MlaC/ttg2D family ABC transporter substrate-binding protein [Vibrio]|uniref:Toluene tolerance protein n=1 Tax=Vibrio genomosp. F6 str. FF-238 TaxID=1191298 RepID=A0A1E5D186_9VIBR|nr:MULTISPECIES: phospholipid-binding protein MlaC [Vibrio]NOH85232.1 phospholipid-binding protein MlaC [Vibrio sp. 03-59-1]OEE77136.1 toluene tolerance protein [Vibrio genomosp. F6 str. FF-238]RBW66986.1 phospholipid-binding protein MlaC [Vibrionales bacterium C3R12]TKF21920.1 phospholipid-binding protein MlaC [Vibrio genomosp. F6]
MFKRILLIASAFLYSLPLFAQEVDQTQPYAMMKQVAEQAFSRLKADQAIIQNDPEHLKVVVEEELMPYVNEQYAALKLLGPNLKAAKKENPKGYKKDVRVFIDAFRGYLVASYAQVLTQYTDQVIEFAPESKIKPTQRIASVRVDIVDAPRPNIKLEFKLRKDKKTGEWKAFDMIAEGISLLSSKQSEWNGKIRQDGIVAVAQELERLAKQPIRFESAK